MQKERLERVREKMRELGIKELVVSDPASIWYLTDILVEPYERFYVLLVRENGHHILFLNKLYNVKDSGFEEIWFGDTDDSVGLLASRLGAGKVGIDKTWPARFLIPVMEKRSDLSVILGSGCVDSCRAVKDAEEIHLMKEASRINDKVMTMAKDFIKEGMSEREAAAFIDAQYKKEGCESPSFTTIVSFGAHAADPHHEPDDTTVKAGDCVLIDMGCRKNRYCSDMTRTFFMKKADPKWTHIHDIVREANERAEAMIKPGVVLKEVDLTARFYIASFGYGEYFTHRLGHFIGQTDHEMGDVSATSEIVAQPGMIFSIEPGIYIPGEAGVRVEDLVLVTETGIERLNKVDKHWSVIG